MTVFRASAYLLPLAVGLVLPAVLAASRARKWSFRRTTGALGGAFLGMAVLLLLAWVPSGEPFSTWLPSVLFSGGAGMLSVGLFLFLYSLRIPPIVAQLGCGLAAVALTGLVFLLGPIVRDAEEAGLPLEERQWRIHCVVANCPYPVMARSIFETDPLHGPYLYATDAADYYDPTFIPPWSDTALNYALAGFALFFLSLVFQALGWRFLPPRPSCHNWV